ncbi:MAG: alpha-E domain-containing protein, partial [bacterium]
MLSRVADSLYWMSRYVERAENLARFVDVNWHMALDVPGDPSTQWQPLVAVTGDMERFEADYGLATRDSVIKFLVFDPEYPNSIYSCLRAARENARMVRQFITLEMFEQLNQMYLTMRDAVTSHSPGDLNHEFFTNIIVDCQLFTGITDSTMSHEEGWNFMYLGRMLERADKTTRLLDVKYFILLPSVSYIDTPYDDLLWGAVLRSASAFEMYRKRYHKITPQRVVKFLIFDRDFPRAVRHCIVMADRALHAISDTPPETFRNQAEKRLGKLKADLDFTELEEVMEIGLHQFLDEFQANLNEVGDAIFHTFFALRPLPQAERDEGDP